MISPQGALRSGEDIGNGYIEYDCDIADLPSDVRRHIADRLADDHYVCEGVVEDDGTVSPKFENGNPCYLRVEGTRIEDLIEAVRHDQEEVREYLAFKSAGEDSAE